MRRENDGLFRGIGVERDVNDVTRNGLTEVFYLPSARASHFGKIFAAGVNARLVTRRAFDVANVLPDLYVFLIQAVNRVEHFCAFHSIFLILYSILS